MSCVDNIRKLDLYKLIVTPNPYRPNCAYLIT